MRNDEQAVNGRALYPDTEMLDIGDAVLENMGRPESGVYGGMHGGGRVGTAIQQILVWAKLALNHIAFKIEATKQKYGEDAHEENVRYRWSAEMSCARREV